LQTLLYYCTLVDGYENKHYPIDATNPIKAIKIQMKDDDKI